MHRKNNFKMQQRVRIKFCKHCGIRQLCRYNIYVNCNATQHAKITIPQGQPWKFQDIDPKYPTFHKLIKMYEPATIIPTVNLSNSL